VNIRRGSTCNRIDADSASQIQGFSHEDGVTEGQCRLSTRKIEVTACNGGL
jgi:hypothetical protein